MQQFIAPMIYVLAFVAVFLLIQAVASVVIVSTGQNKRVNRRLTMMASGMDRDAVFSALVRNPASLGRREGPLGKYHEVLNVRLKQAGLATTPIQFASYVAMGAT